MEKNYKISVIICTKNRPLDFERCIESIFEQTYLPCEVVVVDCSDNWKSLNISEIYKEKGGIQINYTHTTPGLTKQRNIGIGMSRGDILAFLDDDVILDKDYFLQIVSCFTLSSDIMGVGGSIINTTEGKSLVRLYKKIFMLPTIGAGPATIKRSGFPNFFSYRTVTTVASANVLSGCNACYKRGVFSEYAFDEFFDGYGLMEDAEFSFRVSEKHKLMYTSFAKVVHNRAAIERVSLKKYFEMKVINQYYVFRKLVKKKSIDWIFFWWSNIGVLLSCFFWGLKSKSSLPIEGFLKSHREILKKMLCK